MEINHQHSHLIEPKTRRMLCTCQACALLFDVPLFDQGAARQYRRVPRRAERLHDFELSDAQWEAFLIPINMAFFVRNSPEKRVLAQYPGPAGAIESTLDLSAWDDLAEANPALKTLEEDVEALLVYRIDGAREYYRVPVDRCYALVGKIRSHWHGLSGGEDMRQAIQGFFASLHEETSH